MAMKRSASAKPADTKKKRAERAQPKPATEGKPPAVPDAPSAKPAPREARDPADARWRAVEERLTLRLAVLEDVVRRANVDLARRVAELEKRRAGAAA